MARDVIHPTFHHVTLKTTRLQRMIDFYAVVVDPAGNAADHAAALPSDALHAKAMSGGYAPQPPMAGDETAGFRAARANARLALSLEAVG